MDHHEFNLLRLHAIPGVRWRTIHRIFRILEQNDWTLEEFFAGKRETWQKIFRLPTPVIEALAQDSQDIERIAFEWQIGLTSLRARVLSERHPEYPEQIRLFFKVPPPILYWVGDPKDFRNYRWMGWVSSRTLSRQGQRLLEDLLSRMATLRSSLGIVSSVYRPVYRALAQASLQSQRPTLLVPDRGLLQIRNSPLMRLRHARTWIVSPFAPDDVGTGGSGPQRDQVLVSLCHGVVGLEIREGGVMESLLERAIERGKEVWIYQPSYPTSTNRGNFHLLRQGARPYRTISELLTALQAT